MEFQRNLYNHDIISKFSIKHLLICFHRHLFSNHLVIGQKITSHKRKCIFFGIFLSYLVIRVRTIKGGEVKKFNEKKVNTNKK